MRKKYNLFIESLPVPLKRQEEYCKEYRCEEKSFANGGFGSVFRGYRVNDLTDVVIKKMRKSDVYQWGIVNGYRLPLEYCLMNDVLGKDNVIQILDAFDCGDNYVLVMESLKRCLPLDELITTTLDESFIKKLFRNIVDGVRNCHQAGICHRDIKKSNIIVDLDSMKPKLINQLIFPS